MCAWIDSDWCNRNLVFWNVSNVTTFDNMFGGCKRMTGHGIEQWNTASATTMKNMFDDCHKFNPDSLSMWDVSQVKSFGAMFIGCKTFTGKGLSDWDVSNGTDFYSMFEKNVSFDEDLSGMFPAQKTACACFECPRKVRGLCPFNSDLVQVGCFPKREFSTHVCRVRLVQCQPFRVASGQRKRLSGNVPRLYCV